MTPKRTLIAVNREMSVLRLSEEQQIDVICDQVVPRLQKQAATLNNSESEDDDGIVLKKGTKSNNTKLNNKVSISSNQIRSISTDRC